MRDFWPDIVLIDITMPDRDGITACNILKKDITVNPDIPRILMIASHDKNQIIKPIEDGCNDFILKPFQFDELLKKAEKLLETYHGAIPGKEMRPVVH